MAPALCLPRINLTGVNSAGVLMNMNDGAHLLTVIKTQALSLDRKLKQLYLVSVAQFRPEKNHSLQLRAFALARQLAMASTPSKAGESPRDVSLPDVHGSEC